MIHSLSVLNFVRPLQGKVKQIVGSTLSDHRTTLVTNFETEKSAAEFARLYAKDGLFGGHVIMLGSDEASKKSALQALQCRRKARQAIEVSHKSPGNGNYGHDHEILWAIEEMMALISSRAAVHFLKWSENPDLIFGLAYQVAQQHV